MLKNYDSQSQALAIQDLVRENNYLIKIRNALMRRIADLHKYNETMNNKQHLTVLLEEELTKILKGKTAK